MLCTTSIAARSTFRFFTRLRMSRSALTGDVSRAMSLEMLCFLVHPELPMTAFYFAAGYDDGKKNREHRESFSGSDHGADRGAIAEAREAKRRRVHQRRIAGHQVSSQLAGSRANAEAMAGEAGGQKQPR